MGKMYILVIDGSKESTIDRKIVMYFSLLIGKRNAIVGRQSQ